MKLFIYPLVIFSSIAFSRPESTAQTIRKDYREFTRQEMTDYAAALQILKDEGEIDQMADHHMHHFNSAIHTTGSTTGELFLPWHRFFLLDLEWKIRNTDPAYDYLVVPYWDWRTDRNKNAPDFWDNDFLAASNFPGWDFTRSTASDGSLATTAQINDLLQLTTFWRNTTVKNSGSTDFSHRLELFHDNVHQWVGGTMSTNASPRDPVFYLHHNFIDKIWQDWEDRTSGLQSEFPSGNQANMPQYKIPDYPKDILANALKDSRNLTQPAISAIGRNQDVWFAFNGKVLLRGSNGDAFVCDDPADPYRYRYTAAKTPGGTTLAGTIYVGDIRRDAQDSVVLNDQGGFVIEAGATVDFRAGESIVLKPGFHAKAGSAVSAQIISSPGGLPPANLIAGERLAKEAVQKPGRNIAFQARIAPNPAPGRAVLTCLVPGRGSLQIDLFDAMGRPVRAVFHGESRQGLQDFELHLQALHPGIYFCVIRWDGQATVIRLIHEG